MQMCSDESMFCSDEPLRNKSQTYLLVCKIRKLGVKRLKISFAILAA